MLNRHFVYVLASRVPGEVLYSKRDWTAKKLENTVLEINGFFNQSRNKQINLQRYKVTAVLWSKSIRMYQ